MAMLVNKFKVIFFSCVILNILKKLGLVKFALDHGAPIDSVINGYMPLQLACISETNIAVVQYLIDRGADVNAQR